MVLSDLLLAKMWHQDINQKTLALELVLWTTTLYYQSYREIVISEE